jgi:hypothetical protein
MVVDFKNGAGSVTITVCGPNWAAISKTDREWVFSMFEALKGYARETEAQ